MPHIYHFGVTDILKALAETFETDIAADITSVIALVRALVVAVSIKMYISFKAILTMLQIRSSPQRKLKFRRIQEAEISIRRAEAEGRGEAWVIEGPLELILDVATRWSSTCLMLERALKLRSVRPFLSGV